MVLNLEKFGVQELDIKEQENINGGWTITNYRSLGNGTWIMHVDYYERNHYLHSSETIVDSLPAYVLAAIR